MKLPISHVSAGLSPSVSSVWSYTLPLFCLFAINGILLVSCGGGGEGSVDPPGTNVSPNLIVDNVVHSLCTVERGSSVEVTDTIRNVGDGAILHTFRVGIYLSEDQFIDSFDLLIGNRWVDKLEPGESSSASGQVHIPSSVTSGSYYIGAWADDFDSVTESEEGGNDGISISCTQGSIEVIDPSIPLPDLIVLANNHDPCQVEKGDTIIVSDSIQNQGLASATSFRVGIFLSTDRNIDTGDELIGYRPVSTLSVGATSSGSSNLTVPSSIQTGTYYVGAIADYLDDLTEGVETNNSYISTSCSNGQLEVLDPPNPPDLVLDTFSHSPCSLEQGQQITVNLTARNIGLTVSPDFSIGVYQSTDNLIDTNDTLLGYWTVLGLGVGSTSSHSGTFTMNSSGTFYIGGIADYLGQVAEGSEVNNTRLTSSCSGKVTVTDPPSWADLEITTVSHNPCSVDKGDQVTVNAVALNSGNKDASSFEVGVYLSTDTTITTGDTRIGEFSVNSLLMGNSKSLSGGFAVPGHLSTGRFYVGCIADWRDSINESNGEGNNDRRSSSCSNGSLDVTSSIPDLIMTAATHGSCSADLGAAFSVNCTVKNNGTGNASSFEVGVYLSTDTTISTGDTRIGEFSVGSLSAGSSRALSGSVTVPSSMSVGTYYVGCIADWNDQISEGNNSNNVLRSSSCSNGSIDIASGVREAYLYPLQDMIVASGLSSANFAGTIWNSYLGLGDDKNCIYGTPIGQVWTYVEFDISNAALIAAGVPSNYVNNLQGADFEWFKVQSCSPSLVGEWVRLEVNNSSWNWSTITWDNQPGGGGTSYDTVLANGSSLRWPLMSPGIWSSWRARNGGSNNYGMLIRLKTPTDGTWAAGSLNHSNSGFRPYIKVTW